MKQKFAFSRGAEARYKPGFRPYFQDRDLGVKQATGGRFTLKGWIRVWIDGAGEFTFSAGDTWIQPPGVFETHEA